MALISKYSLNGNANDLVWSNNWTALNVTWVDGKMNWWASFNWTTSTIIMDAPNYSWTQNFSISSLIFVNQLPSSTNITMPISYVEWSIDSWIYDKSFDINSSWEVSFRVFYWSSKSAVFSSISTWKWYHIVWTYDWTTIKIYVNWLIWSIQAIASWTYWFTVPKIWFSWNWASSRVRFNGKIDEVELHNTSLTATEIKNKYLYYNGFYNV